jgi:exodeoxyribonuclease V gamma subunit
VTHLALHLAGAPLTTTTLSKKGIVTLDPVPIAKAEDYVRALLLAWHKGMQGPLPCAALTAFTWLTTGDEGAAGKAYQGDDYLTGEVAMDAYLSRVYPDFAALTASGAFFEFADTLYLPIVDAIKKKAPKSDATSDSKSAVGGKA